MGKKLRIEEKRKFWVCGKFLLFVIGENDYLLRRLLGKRGRKGFCFYTTYNCVVVTMKIENMTLLGS